MRRFLWNKDKYIHCITLFHVISDQAIFDKLTDNTKLGIVGLQALQRKLRFIL